jgi:hypothetical protein
MFMLFYNEFQRTYGHSSNFGNTILYLINVNCLSAISFFLCKTVDSNHHFSTLTMYYFTSPYFLYPVPSPYIVYPEYK